MQANGTSAPQGASSEVARDINRRIVLNLIRTRQPVSRADLARLSGLQRSTISLIIDQLIEEKWVVDGQAAPVPRGRRPTFVHLNGNRLVVGVDIRPTQTTVALADLNGNFIATKQFATALEPEEGVAALAGAIRTLADGGQGHTIEHTIEGVGISLPGRIDPRTQKLAFAPNLGWREIDLRAEIASATGIVPELENAANACVLSAIWFRGMDPASGIAVITVSEGIGAGFHVNGKIVHGLNGMAGEFGHVQLDPAGPRCACGRHGCWEVFASNQAAVRYYGETSGGSTDFNGFLRLADAGDVHALAALDRVATYLARGIAMISTSIAPDTILLIGEIASVWGRFGPAVERRLAEAQLAAYSMPRLLPVAQAAEARIQGAVALVLQRVFA